MRLFISSLLVVVTLTGCFASSGSYPNEYGTVTLQADEKGMRAFGDTMNALITNGKATPNHTTQAWAVRAKQTEVEEAERTKRFLKPSFMDSLFAPVSKRTSAPAAAPESDLDNLRS